MSDEPFMPPRPPLMSPETARDLARASKGMARQLDEVGVRREAARMERDSQWWLTYSIALAQTPPKAA
jgi:hypothetical protein